MNKLTLSLFLACNLITLENVFAQEKLADIWKNVEQNYVGVKSKDYAIQSATANEKWVKSKALPKANIQLQNTYGTLEAANGGFFPQNGFFNVSSPWNTSGSNTTFSTFGSTVIDYEIYGFGRQRKENEAAKVLSEKSEDEKTAYLLELKKELSKRYISLVYSENKLLMVNKNTTRLQDIKTVAGALARSGIMPAADSLLASSTYTQSLADKDRWIGIKHATSQYITELYGKNINNISADNSPFTKPETWFVDQENINRNHPYIDILYKESQYLQTSESALLKSSLPSLKMLGGYAYRGSGIDPNGFVSSKWNGGFSNSANNVLVGVGLTWNLTSIVSNKHKASSISFEHDKVSSQIKELELNLQSRSNAVNARLMELQNELKNTNDGVEQALQAYEMYLARYKSGLISLSDLLQTRLLLENAENRHLDAAYEYWMQIIERSELQADFTYLFKSF